MRLSMCIGDHAAAMQGLPKGLSPERLADYAAIIRDEVLALYAGEKASRVALAAETPDAD